MADFDAEAREEGYCAYIGDGRGKPCHLTEGWGYKNTTSGFCSNHGDRGAPEGNQNAVGNEGGSAPKDNTNRVEHGAYADQSNLYSQEFTDVQQSIADDIYDDYRDRYLDEHGDIPTGHELRLFKISVNAVTEIRVENWSTQKPEKLDSGTVLIDREERKKVSEEGVIKEIRYKKTPALAAKTSLSNDNRKWLKDLNLLDSPESQQADAIGSFAQAISNRES